MGYQDLPLGLDSAPLVQQMMEDLVADTETMQENEQQIAKLKEKIDLLESQIEPLQSENTRLTRENVQLHQQLVQAQEDGMKTENESSVATFELQAENRRLKLLNQKATEHVKEMQAQIDKLKAHLQQSIAAPSMMKVPEVMESDPRKLRRPSSRTAPSSRATSVVSSESSFTIPTVSFDPNLVQVELDNLRKERDTAVKTADDAVKKMADLEKVVQIRDEEIHRLGSDLQRETGKDGFLVSLRHKYDQQKAEIEKLRAMVRVVNPGALGHKRSKPLVLTPPRTMVSIYGDEMLSVSGSHYDPKGRVTFTDSPGRAPSVDSRMLSESSATFDLSITDDGYDTPDEEEEVPEPKQPIAPEPMPGTEDPAKREEERKREEEARKAKELERERIRQQKKEQRKKKVRVLLKEKDDKISALRTELKEVTKALEEKEEVLTKMAVDFAFIGDNVNRLVAEKDQLICELKNRPVAQPPAPPEIIIDTEEIDNLQRHINELKAKHKEEIQKKDQQIDQLQSLAQSLAKNTAPGECKECIRLRQQLEDCQHSRETEKAAAKEEIEKLKSRSEQLEVLIRTSDDVKRTTTAMDAELQHARNQLTEKEDQMEKLRAAAAAQQNELKDCQRMLEETRKKLKGAPDMEEKYKSIVDQLKQEHVAMGKDLKQKTGQLKALGDKVTENQRVIRELQRQLQKAREDAETSKEEAAFHRAKSEEITHKMTEQSSAAINEANSTMQHLTKQLQEKTKESNLYQKLLSEARRQLAPLTESTIPALKQKISRLEKDKDDILKGVRKVAQMAIYVEASIGVSDSPDVAAFSTALHQLQDQLKQYQD